MTTLQRAFAYTGGLAAILVASQWMQESAGLKSGVLTTVLVAITVVASFAAWRSVRVADGAVFFPPAVTFDREYHRFLTYGFVHADTWHLLFNMFAFWSFGTVAEVVLAELLPATGGALFMFLYLSALVVSIVPSYRAHRRDGEYVSLGASGAVSAILAFAILIDPFATVYVYFVPMPGWVFLVAYIAVSVWLSKRPGSRVNHLAHLVGALYGVVALVALGALFRFNVLLELVKGIAG